MLLAIDYDETYTLDPLFWDEVIYLAQNHGHNVTPGGPVRGVPRSGPASGLRGRGDRRPVRGVGFGRAPAPSPGGGQSRSHGDLS